MKQIPFVALALLTGCIANDTLYTSSMASNNVSNLSRVSIGMSQEEVLCIMHKPHSQETLLMDGNDYEFWFYITRVTVLGQTRMVPQNVTPLIFKNQVLVGWGSEYYKRIIHSHDIRPKSHKKDLLEHPPLQKALEKATQPGPLQTEEKPKEKDQITMSKKPSEEEEEPKEEKPEPLLDEKDEKMLEEEQEQNFDFW